jgi:acyl carrier protein
MTTFEAVRDMMVDQFKLDPAQITLEATLESLQIDSLSALEFVFLLQEKFELATPAEYTGNLRCVRDVVSEIDRLLAKRPTGVNTRGTCGVSRQDRASSSTPA